MFHALAKVPHLHIVPKVADALGRTGVGIRVPSQGGTFTAIFDPRTFRPLGVNSINRAVAFREALVVQRHGRRPGRPAALTRRWGAPPAFQRAGLLAVRDAAR